MNISNTNNKQKPLSNQKLGVFLVLLAGVSWGITSIFVNNLADFSYSSLQIITIRAWLSAFLLTVYFFFTDRSLFRINLKDIWMFIGSGTLSLTLFSYCYFSTILRCGAAIAVVLLYTSPIFVMLMSALFFKEKLTKIKLFALIFTIIGCFLVAGSFHSSQQVDIGGLLIGLLSGFGYALYSIFAGFAVKKYSPLTVTYYTFLVSGISLLFLCNPVTFVNSFESKSLTWLFGISIICTVMPYLCYTIGLKQMEASRAAVLVTVEPLVGCLIGIFLYKEPVNIFKIIGIILIFCAVFLLSRPEQ